MDYILRNAHSSEKEVLYNFKIQTILDFNKMSVEKKQKVSSYISGFIDTHINDYKLIVTDNKIIGCYCSYLKEDCIFIDEIFIEKEFRNLGIGTNLINLEIQNAKFIKMDIELWVYKDNKKAINLYKKF